MEETKSFSQTREQRAKQILDKSEPQMLDENGELTTTPYYVENVTYDLIDFGQFSLPTAYPVI